MCYWPQTMLYFEQLSLSSVPVQSNLNWDLALNMVITTHPHPPHREISKSSLLQLR